MKKRSLHIIRDEHASLAAMLHAMLQLVERGPLEDAQNFFEVMRAMLFYIDEFPERLHHPKESNLLFPKLVKRAPEVMGAIDRLERDHIRSEKAARDLLHLLIAWELLGNTRRADFVAAFPSLDDAKAHYESTTKKERFVWANILSLETLAIVWSYDD